MSKNPTLIPQAFANNGSKNTIQNTRQPGQDMEDATWSDGFPNVTMQPVESGGLPPKGMDFNGIFNTLSESIVYLQKGGLFYFDKAYANAFGGYQTGAILIADDNTRLFVSTMDKNSNDPNQKMTGWEILAGVGINAATASKLLNGRKIGGVLFDGSQDIDLPGVNKAGNQDTSGNAATATKLKTARLINGIPFDGTKDVNTIPSGAIMYFAQNFAPIGWLKANGAALSRTTYANLFAAIGTLYGSGDGKTTFNLPDLRGEFIRSWDDGRGVDSARKLGEWQTGTPICHDDTAGIENFDPVGMCRDTENFGDPWIGRLPEAYWSTFYGKRIPAGSADFFTMTRPRNIALLACIKI